MGCITTSMKTEKYIDIFTRSFLETCIRRKMTRPEIAHKVGCSIQTVYKYQKKYNIHFPRWGTIKYPVNNEYFDRWSHNMAYILGFLIADGYIRKSTTDNNISVGIHIHRQDIEIVNFIKSEISPSRPIHYESDAKIRFLFTANHHLYERLGELGVFPNKTGKEFMPYIPSKYKGSWLNGVLIICMI